VIWEDEDTQLVVVDTGGPISLTLWQTDQKIKINQETASYPIFRTQDAILAREALQAKGVRIGEVNEDELVNYFFFYDPDGNILEHARPFDFYLEASS
jgi:hypothetical protein